MRHIILGTAGHIDHGKSSLVKALTGIDPDRLKEEKERGITIDIGFADLVYSESDLLVGIVDVPGHEKLIRNMLAGAGGIDFVLMVIAADEGLMPQSREHLAICNLLKIKSGLIAVTKCDLVEKDWLGLIIEDIKGFVQGTFLDSSPIIPVSSRTGENIDLLKREIRDAAMKINPKTSDGLFRLPIDRVFTLKGFGTVITGTAISGRISVDDPLEILPGNIQSKVRGLHSHGRSVDTVYAGQRAAINLQSVEKEDIKRGDVAVIPARFHKTYTINVYMELLDSSPVIKNRSLIHFYSGTSEVIARIVLYEKTELKAGEECYCQLRLKDPVVVMSGDRFIIRRFSPLETLGGGEILDPFPARKRGGNPIKELQVFHKGSLIQKISVKIEGEGTHGISLHEIEGWVQAELSSIADAVRNLADKGEIVNCDDRLIHKACLTDIQGRISDLINDFHIKYPLKPGMDKEELRKQLNIEQRLFQFFTSGINNILVEKNLVRLKNYKVSLSDIDEGYKEKILAILEKGKFQPVTKDELCLELKMTPKHISDILSLLSKNGTIIKINDSIFLSKNAYDDMISLLRSHFAQKIDISVAEFRDLLKTSRKYALPFLEFLDSRKVTMRIGDVRKMILRN